MFLCEFEGCINRRDHHAVAPPKRDLSRSENSANKLLKAANKCTEVHAGIQTARPFYRATAFRTAVIQ